MNLFFQGVIAKSRRAQSGPPAPDYKTPFVTGEQWTFSASETEMYFAAPVGSKHNQPLVLFDDVTKRTHFAFPSRIDTGARGTSKLITYDPLFGLDRPHFIGRPITTGADQHLHPSLGIHNNRIYSFMTNPHTSEVIYFKSTVDGEYEDFAEMEETIGTVIGYPNIVRLGDGNFMMWHREGSASYRSSLVAASNGLEDWGTPYNVTTQSISGSRHYTTKPRNHKVNGTYYYEVARLYNAADTMPDKFVLLTDDHITFRNIEGTFSKNVVSEGAITDTELNNNFRFIAGADSSVQLYSNVGAVSPDGVYYNVTGDGEGGYKLMYFDTEWHEKTIEIEGLQYGNVFTGPFFSLIAYSESNLEVICLVDDGTNKRIHRYISTDQGDSWDFLNDPFDSFESVDMRTAEIPENILEIPSNHNFIIVASQDTANPLTRVYIAKCAFGTIQEEPGGDPDTAISDFTTVSGLEFWYKAESASLTHSGANVTALLDKSGNGRDASGTCTWDEVNELIFTSESNNKFDLPLSGLSDLPACTYIVVARSSVAATLLSFTDSSASNKLAQFRIRGSSPLSADFRKVNGSLSYEIRGQDNARDNNLHVISWSVGNRKLYIWIDGVLQFFAMDANMTQDERVTLGTLASDISTVDNVTIGADILSTGTTYYTHRRREECLFSRVLSRAERKGIEKDMATRYSITLGNQYL